MALLHYFCNLSTAKRVLWCYLLWYLCMAIWHFDASLHLWLTSLGISLVVGIGLVLGVLQPGKSPPDTWTIVRLFLTPFCVSSFSALVKDQGFVLIFSPRWHEDALALAVCAAFVLLSLGLKVVVRR